jgi:hypothetical protein
MREKMLYLKRFEEFWHLHFGTETLVMSDQTARNVAEYILARTQRQGVFRAAGPADAANAVEKSNAGN